MQLVGAQVEGQHVRLMWYAPQTPDADYAVFVHVLHAGALVAQHDSDPTGGLYPTSQWRPGDMVIDDHVLAGAWDAQRDQVMVGLYRRDTGQRLPVVDAAGNCPGRFGTSQVEERSVIRDDHAARITQHAAA